MITSYIGLRFQLSAWHRFLKLLPVFFFNTIISKESYMSAETSSDPNTKPLWTPSTERVRSTLLYSFMQKMKTKHDAPTDSYHVFWEWTNAHMDVFWDEMWDFCGIIGEKGGTVFQDAADMREAKFFPQGRLNYAENILRKNSGETAIISCNEKGEERRLSRRDLCEQVSRLQQFLIEKGVKEGDRVAGYMPNIPETIIAHLAAASLGAIWSSASPDFGVQGLLDRFGQIEPKVLIVADGYFYNGKTLDCLDKVKEVSAQIKGLEHVILVNFTSEDATLEGAHLYRDIQTCYTPAPITFKRVPFDHPLVIMFSSGTTGKPKCIVHGHGGTLLQHVKEFKFHCDIKPGNPVFYFTTCGWMMWNWLLSALACDAPLLLFDGSPFYPDGNILWDFTSKHHAALFGTSAKYIDALKKNDLAPAKTHNLSALKIITSTGSPLVHESFDYVYQDIKEDVHLASIYGGTDIISASFGLGNPISPVYRGELQGPALASAVDIFDENGKSIPEGGGAGELVCLKPFPSMPVCFWDDEDGTRYHDAYFDTYPGIWRHGDWAEKTNHHGLIVHGRSDATLNPGGVRIGTAEIYRQVEQIPQILESIAVGQDWDGDVRVILFIVMKPGAELTDELVAEIKSRIRSGASPRHVPAKVIAVPDIPRTKSGKITELAVRDVIHNRPIKNKTALANPEALEHYTDLSELAS